MVLWGIRRSNAASKDPILPNGHNGDAISATSSLKTDGAERANPDAATDLSEQLVAKDEEIQDLRAKLEAMREAMDREDERHLEPSCVVLTGSGSSCSSASPGPPSNLEQTPQSEAFHSPMTVTPGSEPYASRRAFVPATVNEVAHTATSPVVFNLSAEDDTHDEGESVKSGFSSSTGKSSALTNSPCRDRVVSVSLDDMYDFSGFPSGSESNSAVHSDPSPPPQAREQAKSSPSPLKPTTASQNLRVKFLEDALLEVRRELEERQGQLGRASKWRQRAQLKIRQMDAALQLKRKEVSDLYAENVKLETLLREKGAMTIEQQPQEAPTGDFQRVGKDEELAKLAESHKQVQRLTATTSQLVDALRRASEKQQKFQAEAQAYEERADKAEELAAEAEARIADAEEAAQRRTAALEQEMQRLRFELARGQEQLASRGQVEDFGVSKFSMVMAEVRASEQPQEGPNSPRSAGDSVTDEKLSESHKQVQRLTDTMGQLVEALKNANRKEEELQAQLSESQGELSEAKQRAEEERQQFQRAAATLAQDSVRKAEELGLELVACREELAAESQRAFKAQARLVQVEARFNLPQAMVAETPAERQPAPSYHDRSVHVPFQV